MSLEEITPETHPDVFISVPVDIYNTAKAAAEIALVAYRGTLAHLKDVRDSIPLYPPKGYIPTTGFIDGVAVDRFVIEEAIRYYERKIHEATALVNYRKASK